MSDDEELAQAVIDQAMEEASAFMVERRRRGARSAVPDLDYTLDGERILRTAIAAALRLAREGRR